MPKVPGQEFEKQGMKMDRLAVSVTPAFRVRHGPSVFIQVNASGSRYDDAIGLREVRHVGFWHSLPLCSVVLFAASSQGSLGRF